MKRFCFVVFLSALLGCICSCKIEISNPNRLPQLPGIWTSVSTNTNANAIFATGNGFIAYNFSMPGSPVYYSGNQGVTWNITFHDSSQIAEYEFATDMMNNLRLIMYSSGDSTFYLSTNGGQSWSFLNHTNIALGGDSDAPSLFSLSGNRLFAISSSFSPSNLDSTFYDYLLKSDNFGNTWDTVFRQSTSFSLIAGTGIRGLVYIDGSILMYDNHQFLRSTDNGITWTTYSTTVPYNGIIGTLSNGSILGYDEQSIWKSIDSCRSWSVALSSNYDFGNGANPAIAFDSCVLINIYGLNGGLAFVNPNRGKWLAADTGLTNITTLGGTINQISLDNQYVYILYSYGYSQGGSSAAVGIYRRPRTDFAHL